MYCSNCGSKINPGSKFCANCGHGVQAGSEQPANTSSPPPPPPVGTSEKAGYTQPPYASPPGQPPPPSGYMPPGQGSGQPFNPQFNQKKRSGKGCLLVVIALVLLIVLAVGAIFVFSYYQATPFDGLPGEGLIGSITSSGPEKTVENFFDAVAAEDVDAFLNFLTEDSILWLEEDAAYYEVPLEEDIADFLSWMNADGQEYYGQNWHKQITYTLLAESEDRAEVVATLDDEPANIFLAKEGGQWKIDWVETYGW